MVIRYAQQYRAQGLLFSIRGEPYSRRTTIELLTQGPHRKCLMAHPELKLEAMGALAQYYRLNTPVDTGRLRASVLLHPSGRSPFVTLGPEPYDRALLKAVLGGRSAQFLENRRVRRKALGKRGPVKKWGFYALPANTRSQRIGYVEDGIDSVTPAIVQACRSFEEMERQELELQRVLGTLGIGRRI